ncbi:MAG: hypothetical protein AAGA65_29310 [Actinomycetota bacterium]
MQSVPITFDRPLLGAVFGSMSTEAEAEVRAGLLGSTAALAKLAEELGGVANGVDCEGLSLGWLPSGQVDIEGYVAVPGATSITVTFMVELRPSWFYGVSDRAGWDIETTVAVRCTHDVDHGEHIVDERLRSASTPKRIVEVLAEEVVGDEGHTAIG